MTQDAADIVRFWREAGIGKWFGGGAAFDAEVRTACEAAHMTVARGDFAAWEATAEGALALLLLLDQVPRNLYRHTNHAFATDPLAIGVAERALAKGFDTQVEPGMRLFFYLPFEHHEDAASQARAVALFAAHGVPELVRFAELHADIIRRFGRFPHRNQMLGRESTAEELKFLSEGGFAG